MLKLKESLPKANVLNKPLLLGLGSTLVIIFLWSFVSSLQHKSIRNDAKPLLEDSQENISPRISPIISQLPQGYQDADTIKKYLTPVPAIPPEVTQELNDLRSQTIALQTQLSQIQAHPVPPPQPPVPVMDQESLDAEKSNLFFSSQTPDGSLFVPQDQNKAENVGNDSGTEGGSSPFEQQNMQNQKKDFLITQQKAGDIYNPYKMIKPISPYEIQAGTLISASILTAINTSLPGSVVAQVRNDVYDSISGQYLLIPKGSKLLGQYDSKIAYGQRRVLIIYNRIIRPDGTSIQLNNFPGSDQEGQAGFMANVDNHWGKILGAATISTLLSFGAGIAADGASSNNSYYPNSQQNAILGAAGSVSQIGQQLTSRAIDIQPTLTVPAGFNFNIIVNKDLILSPFNRSN